MRHVGVQHFSLCSFQQELMKLHTLDEVFAQVGSDQLKGAAIGCIDYDTLEHKLAY